MVLFLWSLNYSWILPARMRDAKVSKDWGQLPGITKPVPQPVPDRTRRMPGGLQWYMLSLYTALQLVLPSFLPQGKVRNCGPLWAKWGGFWVNLSHQETTRGKDRHPMSWWAFVYEAELCLSEQERGTRAGGRNKESSQPFRGTHPESIRECEVLETQPEAKHTQISPFLEVDFSGDRQLIDTNNRK